MPSSFSWGPFLLDACLGESVMLARELDWLSVWVNELQRGAQQEPHMEPCILHEISGSWLSPNTVQRFGLSECHISVSEEKTQKLLSDPVSTPRPASALITLPASLDAPEDFFGGVCKSFEQILISHGYFG